MENSNKYMGLSSVCERGIVYGAPSLNDVELVMTVLGIDLATSTDILDAFGGLRGLIDTTTEELEGIKSIGKNKALVLKAAVEIGQRIVKTDSMRFPIVKSPDDAAKLVMEEMRYLDREHFKILLLNMKNRVISVENVAVGTLGASAVHPRETFKVAVKKSAAGIILVHNHPSGDPTPSREDIEVTKRLKEAGKIIGIDVLDHVVIGDGRFVSFESKGLI